MIDLEQEVEMLWSSRNKYWYIERGYIFTKMQDKFFVKAKDLPNGSRAKVKYTCDMCGKEIVITYQMHNKKEKQTKDLCFDCHNKVIPCTTRLSIEFVREKFEERGYILLSDKYINNRKKLKYICPNHPNDIQTITYDSLQSGCGCYLCAKDRIRGENHYLYNGGFTALSTHLRSVILPWVKDSMEKCSFKCILTKEGRNWNVHHLYGFNLIVKEVLELLKINLRKHVFDYTEEEITLINNKCLQLHYEYGLGVCIREDLHTLFHSLYGKGDNTPEQFYEFIDRYKAGEFNE